MSEVFPEGSGLPCDTSSRTFPAENYWFSIRIKCYISHSMRYRVRGHTRQLKVECRKPPARTRTAPTVNPSEVFNTSKALALTQKGLQWEREEEGEGTAWGMQLWLGKCNVHGENNCRSVLKCCHILPLTRNLLGRFIVYHYCYHKAFKRIGTQISLLFFSYLIDLGKVFIGEEGKRVNLLIKRKYEVTYKWHFPCYNTFILAWEIT